MMDWQLCLENPKEAAELIERMNRDIASLRAELEAVKRERDYWERNANEMNAHWKREPATFHSAAPQH